MNFGKHLKEMLGLPLADEDQIPFIAFKRKAEESEAQKVAAQKQDAEKKQS